MAILLCAITVSCSYTKDDHPEIYGKYFSQIDTIKDFTKATIVLDELGHLMEKTTAGEGDKVRYYDHRAATYQGLNNFEKAFLYIDSIVNITARRQDEERFVDIQAHALLRKSDCYQILKNYDASMKYLLQSKVTLNNKKDSCKYFGYNDRIAQLLYFQKQFTSSINYYKKAILDEYVCSRDSISKFANIQRFYDNIGLAFAGAGKYDSASYFFQITLDYLLNNQRRFPEKADYIALARAVVYANLAKIKQKQQFFDQAESLYTASIKGTQGIYPNFTTATKFDLADLSIDRDKLGQAVHILNTLETTINRKDNDNIDEERKTWNLAMEKLWAKRGNTPRAFTYNSRYLAIKDSLDLVRKRNIKRDIGRELENREQNAINAMLEKENASKSFRLVVVILLSLLVIAGIFFVWYNLRRKEKHVALLEEFNNEISAKNYELMEALGSLEEGQSQNAKITRAVAHDLRHSITRIHTTAHVLLKKVPDDDLREVMELIKTACSNSIILINDLIKENDWFDKEKMEDVDFQRVLQNCVTLLQTKADEKNQQLYLQGDSMIVPLNRQKMWRVISNILNNAIKFSPENAIINVKLEKKAHTVLLSVKDHGIGIPTELKDKIFTLHPEASRVGTAGEESHGLGLSISRRIVEEHDGKLWFESEEGKGCTFFVELPGKN